MESSKKSWRSISAGDRWIICTSIVGVLISAAGFFMVVKSLISSEKIASNNTYLQTYSWANDIDKSFYEHPELKKYLKGNTTAPAFPKADPYNKIKTEAFAEYMLDNYDAILNNTSYFKIDTSAGRQWMQTVVLEFKDYPVLRKVFAMDSDLYGGEIRKAYHISLKSKK